MRGGSFYLTGNQLQWLAGLLEGEGSFVAGAPSEPRIPTLAINMTDLDVMQAVAHLCGSTVASRQPGTHVKTMYRTALRGGSAVALMKLIQPFMGARRQQQITHAMACWSPNHSRLHRMYHQIDDTLPNHERRWLAGYLEGEGCFGVHTTRNSYGTYRYPIVQLNTTDPDIAERVQRLWHQFYNVHINVNQYQPTYVGSKMNYHLAAKGPRARRIMEDLSPLLFARRQAQISYALTTTKS